MPSQLLIVEDSCKLLALLSELFSHMGHEVSTASDGKAAMEAIAKGVPDILVLDIPLPFSYEVLSSLRQKPNGRHTKVILLICDWFIKDIKDIPGANLADHVLTKPVAMTDWDRVLQST